MQNLSIHTRTTGYSGKSGVHRGLDSLLPPTKHSAPPPSLPLYAGGFGGGFGSSFSTGYTVTPPALESAAVPKSRAIVIKKIETRDGKLVSECADVLTN